MITIILQSSLCWLVFLLVYQLFLRKETFFRFNRYYLLVTLLLGVLMPVFRMIWELIYPDPFRFQTFASFQGTAQVLELPSEPGLDKINWLLWLNRMYWTGVIVFVLVLMKQIITIIKTIRSNPKLKLEGYTLVNTDYAHLPFSFMGYVFISNQVEFKDEELNRILKHESSHVHGGHSMDVILIELIKCLAWFSPLVYWYKNSIRNTHEYLADALVLKSTDTQSYGQLLIHNSQQGLQMALVNHFIYSQLKNRINMMIKSPSRPLNVWKYTLIIPILFLLGVMFAYKSDTSNSNDSKAPLSIRAKDSLPVNVLYILNGEKSTEDEIKNVYPQQITSMNVIKDKEAIKQYGEEGKNGIIQINTRTLYLIDEIESSKEAVDKINPDDIATMDVVKYGKSSTGVVKIRLKKSSIEVNQETPLKQVDQMPSYPGGQIELLKYLAANIKYPASAYKDKIEGKVFVSFVVEKDGTLGRTYIEKGIDGACNNEALRVIRKMNTDGVRWSPGKNEGQEVPVVFTLPISFKLENSNNSFNKPQGSVKVKVGDQFLRPDQYEIDAKTGNVRVTDQTIKAIVISGIPFTVYYEDNSLFDYNTNSPNDLSIRKTSNATNNSNTIREQKIFTEVDELPRFPGCESETDIEKRSSCATQKMFEFINAHLKYPLQAKDLGIQGKVLVSFIVNPDGSISMAKVLKDIGGGCAESAMDMMREMNTMIKWIPGKSGGKAVSVEYVLPISFNLIGTDKNVSKVKTVPKTNQSPQENKLKVIPNPASHQVEINWTKGGDLKIELIDVSGRVVIQNNWTNFNGKQIIDVSKLPKGTYIVRVIQGIISEEQKLLVQ